MASLGDLVVRMRGDISDFQRKMDKVERRLSRLERSFNRVGAAAKRLKGWLVSLGAGYLGFRGLQSTLSQFMEFDDMMRKVGARSQATENDLGKLTHIAEELGRTTSHTAVEIAEMMGILGQAGFRSNQIGEMIDAVADLKRATDSDSETAAGVMASTLRVFQLESTDATRVADAFTSATIESQASLEDLAGAMSYVGENVTSLGLSLEQTLGFMELLHNRNIRGERAGTALRRTFSTLAAEAERLGDVFGTSLIDEGSFVGVPEALRRINAITAGMDGADKLKVFKEAFQLLGMESALVLGKTGDQLDTLVDKMGEAGSTAKDVAGFMDSGFGGVIRRLSSAWSGLVIRVGHLMATILTPLIERITELLNHVASDEVMGNIAKQLESIMIAVGNFMSSLTDGSALEYLALEIQSTFADMFHTLAVNLEFILRDAGRMMRDMMTGNFDEKKDYFRASNVIMSRGMRVSDTSVKNAPRIAELKAIMEKNGKATADAIRDMGLQDLFKVPNDFWEEAAKPLVPFRLDEPDAVDPVKDTVQSLNQGAGAALLKGSLEAYQTQFLRRSPQLEVAKKQLEEQKRANQKLDKIPQEFGNMVVTGLSKGVVGVN